jgi:hypothetical protein
MVYRHGRAVTWQVQAVGLLAAILLLSACEVFMPLREPPPRAAESPPGRATTRAEVVELFGPPDEIRASDLGEVLVYRRIVVVDANPNRYYGQDRGARLDRYERVMLFLDDSGRIVRWTVDREE